MATLVRRDAEQAGSWERDERIPTPRWWPGGLPLQVSDADPKAKSVVVSFSAPGRPQLARWPVDADPLESWQRPGEPRYAHEYHWTDVRWHWVLRCDIELNDNDLAMIADSMIDISGTA